MSKLTKTPAPGINLWLYFDVELQIRDKICGGIPKSPETIEKWIEVTLSDKSRMEEIIEQTKKDMGVDDINDETLLAELKKSCWNGFKSNDAGLFAEGRCLKAMLKESANIIKKVVDLTAFKARVAERVYVQEDQIPLGVTEADGSDEKMIHIIGPFGPVSALKRVDYVTRPLISFSLTVLNEPLTTKTAPKKIQPEDYLRLLFDFGGENGLGADRSQGYGKFDLVKFEEFTK